MPSCPHARTRTRTRGTRLNDWQILAWDLATGLASPFVGEPHKNRVIALAVCKSGVVSCAQNGTIIVSQSPNTYGTTISLGMEQEEPVAFGCGSTVCVTASSKERLIVTQLPGGTCASVPTTYSPTAIAVASNDSQVAVGGSDNHVHVLGADGSELFKLERHRDTIHAVAISADCAKLASGCANKEIVVWSMVDGSPLVTGLQGFHTARISCLTWSPGGTLASGGVDASIIVWDGNKPLHKMMQAHIAGAVTALVFTEETTLVSCGLDACVKLWSLDN